MNNRPIGFFDSGVGGLSVLKEFRAAMPNESFVFLGDTKRMPYGKKTKEQVIEYSRKITEFLIKKHNIKALVIACNTATAHALESLVDEFEIPIFGVIKPGVLSFKKTTKSKRGILFATEGTVRSREYLKELGEEFKLINLACPNFVQIVEQHLYDKKEADVEVGNVFNKLKNCDADTIILGCTHYPLLKNAIQKKFPNFALVDPGKETIKILKIFLRENNMLSDNKQARLAHFYASDQLDLFKEIAQAWLELDDIKLEKYVME